MNNENTSILERLETYVPPPYPVSKYLNKECYDYRAQSENPSPVPETIVDTFIFDILGIAGAFGITAKSNVWFALRLIHAVKGYEVLPGFRPWTFWNFVTSLNHYEMLTLEREVEALLNSGRDWQTEKYDIWELPPEYRD